MLPAPHSLMSTICQVPGCGRPVNREGFELCYTCWKDRDRPRRVNGTWVRVTDDDDPKDDEPDHVGSPGEALSSTKIGQAIGLSNQRVNLVLAELGWIEKFIKGWKVTPQGERIGGVTRTSQKGIPYVVWPAAILKNRVFRGSATDVAGEPSEEPTTAPPVPAGSPVVEDGRLRFPAKYRAADGHYVRSRAELSIDNWLYMQGIVHAYERKLPIEEDAYCDFYLPEKKVFIEYWGMEKDPKYAARKEEKRALYSRYALNLVELADVELENLDDNLARLLIRFGVNCT